MPSEPFVNPPLYSAIALITPFAVIFGVIFKDMLEYRVAEWQINRETQDRIYYDHPSVVLTYLATCLLTIAFSSACLMVIGLDLTLSTLVALVLVGSTAALIWWQLGALLKTLVAGGSEAIDIDFFGAEMAAESED